MGILKEKLLVLGAFVSGQIANVRVESDDDEEIPDTEDVLAGIPLVTRKADMTVTPLKGSTTRSLIQGRTYDYKETLRKLGARWEKDHVGWSVSTRTVEDIKLALPRAFSESVDGSSSQVGQRSLSQFLEGVESGQIVPGRSRAENERLKVAAQRDDDADREELEALHAEAVYRAAVQGLPVTGNVLARNAVAQTRLHEAGVERERRKGNTATMGLNDGTTGLLPSERVVE